MTVDTALTRRMIIAASLAGATGVLLGSFAAHGLDQFLESRGFDADLVAKRSDQFGVGVRYHLVHAVALLGLASIPAAGNSLRRWVARLFVAGLLLFSGSLYLLVLTNTPVLGAITPLGGLCWIAAWLLLPFGTNSSPSASTSDESIESAGK